MKNSDFITGKAPITKEEVRAISISKMNLENAKLFVDIGSGTGSITVEVANKFQNISVISVEMEKSAYELTRKNIEKFKLTNVKQIYGEAPGFIKMNEKADAVFIGGSKDNLSDILEWTYENLVDEGVLVANFILLDNFYECKKKLEEIGFRDIEMIQISISKMEKLGKGSYFKPLNPVFVISAKK